MFKKIAGLAIGGLVAVSAVAGDAFYDKPQWDAHNAASAKYVAISAATNANGGTNVVTLTVKDWADASLAQASAFRVWVSDASLGITSAVVCISSATSGTILSKTAANADWTMINTNIATCVLTVTNAPGATNYIQTVIGSGPVTSAALYFRQP